MSVQTGTVKFFNNEKGYGFISREGEDDVFVHFSAIRPLNNPHRTLHKGEYVSFDVGSNAGGPQAVSVTGLMGGPLMCDHAAHGPDRKARKQPPCS